jgi:enoyl-CoA hydratase
LSGPTYGRLLDLINPGVVKDLLFTGRLMSGDEARSLGLVNRLVPGAELDRTVRALAAEIAANAPLTLRATKELVRRVLAKRRLAAGEDADIVEMCYTSRDFREGVSAFLAKRKPVWSGT